MMRISAAFRRTTDWILQKFNNNLTSGKIIRL